MHLYFVRKWSEFFNYKLSTSPTTLNIVFWKFHTHINKIIHFIQITIDLSNNRLTLIPLPCKNFRNISSPHRGNSDTISVTTGSSSVSFKSLYCLFEML